MHDTAAAGVNHSPADRTPNACPGAARTHPQCSSLTLNVPRTGDGRAVRRRGKSGAGRLGLGDDRRGGRSWAAQACLVSQKILEISSILASSSSATAESMLPFVPPAPASLVASL